MIFHGSGNPSWYIDTSGDAALHIVDLETTIPDNFNQGIQWHFDVYNPTGSIVGFIQHLLSEVIPGTNVQGQAGKVFCTIGGGCH
jgi:hypothetical protein